MSHWFRLWHEFPSDPKFRTVARDSGCSICQVQTVFIYLLCCASKNSTAGDRNRPQPNAPERGVAHGFVVEDCASLLDLTDEQVEAILAAMQKGRLLDGLLVLGWAKRQPVKEDGSPERSRDRRQREREAREAGKASNGPRPQPTASDRKRTQPTAPDTDTEVKASHTAGAGACDRPGSGASPGPSDESSGDLPVRLSLEWVPDKTLLRSYAKFAGVPADAFTPDRIRRFILHHEPRGTLLTEKEHVSALVRWVLKDHRTDAVVPIGRGKRPAASADDDWSKGGL